MSRPKRRGGRPPESLASPNPNRPPAKTTDPLPTAIIQANDAKRWPPFLAPEDTHMFPRWRHVDAPWARDGLPDDPMADAAERMPEVIDRIGADYRARTRDFLRKLVGQNTGIHYSDAVKFSPFRDTPVHRELDALIRSGEILLDPHTHRLTPSPDSFGPDLPEDSE